MRARMKGLAGQIHEAGRRRKLNIHPVDKQRLRGDTPSRRSITAAAAAVTIIIINTPARIQLFMLFLLLDSVMLYQPQARITNVKIVSANIPHSSVRHRFTLVSRIRRRRSRSFSSGPFLLELR